MTSDRNAAPAAPAVDRGEAERLVEAARGLRFAIETTPQSATPWAWINPDAGRELADFLESAAARLSAVEAERDALRTAIETILPWLDKEAADIASWGSDDSPASAAAVLRAALDPTEDR